jgi:L-asparagine transporter-like permease
MLAISASSYFCGVALDLGVPARTFAVIIGCVMVIPAAAWAIALNATRPRNVFS